jgi:hypothetical protein
MQEQYEQEVEQEVAPPVMAQVGVNRLINTEEPAPEYAEFDSEDDDNYTLTSELPPLPAKSDQVLSEMKELADGLK